MDIKIKGLVTNFIEKCYSAYDNDPNDIPTFGNTIETYMNYGAQKKYVVMYFAKYVGAWRQIRKQLDISGDTAVASLGAGPELCLLGWFFDHPPEAGSDVRSFDVLDWGGVRELREFTEMRDHVFGKYCDRINYYSGYHFPEVEPPQVKEIRTIRQAPIVRFLDADRPKNNMTVLMPMVLNHLVGKALPMPNPDALYSWIQTVAKTSQRVVILDMLHEEKTVDFWDGIADGLNIPRPSAYQEFAFHQLSTEFSSCYPDRILDGLNNRNRIPENQRRTGQVYAKYCRLTCLVHDKKNGWYWLRS